MDFPHKDSKCPAEGKTCNVCKAEKKHFTSVCHAKKRQAISGTVHNVESSDKSSDSETENYLFGLSSLNAKTSRPKIRIHVNEPSVNILNDTRSSINVMDVSTHKSMKQQPKLCKSDTKVYAYGANEKVSLLGKFLATEETSDKIMSVQVNLTKGKSGNLLPHTTSVNLQVIPQMHSFNSSKAKQLFEEIHGDLEYTYDYDNTWPVLARK